MTDAFQAYAMPRLGNQVEPPRTWRRWHLDELARWINALPARVSSTCAWRRAPAPVLFRQTTAENMRVTSHSILRYLTRVDPVLGEAVVTNLQRMAEESIQFKGDDARWHAKTGLVFIVEDDALVTVLDREQSAKYRGRKLINGEKAE